MWYGLWYCFCHFINSIIRVLSCSFCESQLTLFSLCYFQQLFFPCVQWRFVGEAMAAEQGLNVFVFLFSILFIFPSFRILGEVAGNGDCSLEIPRRMGGHYNETSWCSPTPSVELLRPSFQGQSKPLFLQAVLFLAFFLSFLSPLSL